MFCPRLYRGMPKCHMERQQPDLLFSSPFTSHYTPTFHLPDPSPDPTVTFLLRSLCLVSPYPQFHTKPPDCAISLSLFTDKTSQSHQNCGCWQVTSTLTKRNSQARKKKSHGLGRLISARQALSQCFQVYLKLWSVSCVTPFWNQLCWDAAFQRSATTAGWQNGCVSF